MLESIHIQHFKGFGDTQIGPFKKVNLIIGGQNVGKTSVLEAVQMTLGHSVSSSFRQNEGNDSKRFTQASLADPRLSIAVRLPNNIVLLTRRNLDLVDTPLLQDVDQFYTPTSMHLDSGLVSWYEGGSGGRQLDLGLVAVPLFLPPQLHLVTLFGQVILRKKKAQLIDLLKRIEPRLVSLDAISPDGEQRVYADLDGISQTLTLNQMGHGFSRLVHLFSELLVSEAKLALIDEVENGIHYTALPTLFEGIKVVAQERDVQSLITTHSWDALRAACEVFADKPEMFQVIRLERQGGADADVKAVCIEGLRMLRLMAEEREVR